MRIVFFGTPQFAANILKSLLDLPYEIVGVVTKPDKPKGRSGVPVPTPVKVVAQECLPNVPFFQPEKISDPIISPELLALNADVFVVVAYGEILKQHVLDMPKLGCINIHASLLPHYRGAAPIQRAIIDGQSQTGITIMHMVKKMDAGDMILQVKVPITENMTAGELEQQLCEAGCRAIKEVLFDFARGIIHRVPQEHELATFAPKIELEDCQINWDSNAQDVHNLIRGVNPFPGAWCWVECKGQIKRLKIFQTKVRQDVSAHPRQLLSASDAPLIVSCKDGAISIEQLQLEGKKAMTAADFMRGYQLSDLNFQAFNRLG